MTQLEATKGLGIRDWGLDGDGQSPVPLSESLIPNPQSPTPNPPSPVPAPLPHIKHWTPVQLAGEGSLARVYRARPAGPAEFSPRGAARAADYALKVLRPPWDDDPRAVAMLRREAQVGRTVSHPHLISILAASTSAPPYYVVMPWLSGTTLARVLESGSPKTKAQRPKTKNLKPTDPPSAFRLPLSQVFWIARQVAEALGGLRAAGWRHGDVKPSNIFVGPDGHVTLLDLGFARRIDRPGAVPEQSDTLRGSIAGTYRYIAPEAASPAMPVDIRGDIYSLGIVLYEMLSGRVPFHARDPGELARQHRGCRVPDVRQLAPDVPAEAAALVRAMLAKQPLRRPQSPPELIERLTTLEIATLRDR